MDFADGRNQGFGADGLQMDMTQALLVEAQMSGCRSGRSRPRVDARQSPARNHLLDSLIVM